MIEPAFEALAAHLVDCLAGFIASPSDLKINPTAPFTPTGDERSLVRAAALVSVQTRSVRQILGRPTPRHVVERECRLELAIAGPDRARRTQSMDDVLTALATLPNRAPTLGGAAERLVLTDQAEDELPPNGEAYFLTFILRVRSGDPLGRTP